MPLHENYDGNIIYVKPKGGAFLIESKGQETQKVSAIEGTLSRVWIEFDPGDKVNKIEARDVFVMHIKDTQSPDLYSIKMGLDRNFTFSVAKVLGDLSKDEHIVAKASAGNDPAITFCNILKVSPTGEKVRPAQVEFPTDRDERIKLSRKIIESHPAYREKVKQDS